MAYLLNCLALLSSCVSYARAVTVTYLVPFTVSRNAVDLDSTPIGVS